jgi:hypothetical protein
MGPGEVSGLPRRAGARGHVPTRHHTASGTGHVLRMESGHPEPKPAHPPEQMAATPTGHHRPPIANTPPTRDRPAP